MKCESARKILKVLNLSKLESDNEVQSALMKCILSKSGLNEDAVSMDCTEDGWGFGCITGPYDMQDLEEGLMADPECLADVYISYSMIICGIDMNSIQKALSENTEACATLVDNYTFGEEEILERLQDLLDREMDQIEEKQISLYKKYLLCGCYYLISRIEGCKMEPAWIAEWENAADVFSLEGISGYDQVIDLFLEDCFIPDRLRNKEAESVYLHYLLREHLEFNCSPSSSTTPTLYLYWSDHMAYYKKNRDQVLDASLKDALDKAVVYLEDPVLTLQYQEREAQINGEDPFQEVSCMTSEGTYFDYTFLGIYYYYDLYQSIEPFTKMFYLIRNIFETLFKAAFPLSDGGNRYEN